MKKKIIGIVIAILLVLAVAIVALFMFMPKNNNDNLVTADSPNTLPSDVKEVGGLSVSFFEETAGRDFSFTLKNKKAKYEFTLTPGLKCADFDYEFKQDPDMPELPPYNMIEPGKNEIRIESDYDAQDDVFAFGGMNFTDKATNNFDEMDLVYISYRGSTNWELCGINTGMSKDDVVNLLGEPTRAYSSEEEGEYYMEYYVMKDMHSYTITVTFDIDVKEIVLIELLLDNHPVYEGQGITQEELDAMLAEMEQQMQQ